MNLQPIDYNYINGENIYPLQDYIDEKINTNINSSNVFLNNNLKINDALYFSNDSNLYLKNIKPFGEIRFSTAISYPDNSNINYGTKIDNSGRLFVYHNYNVLQPVYAAGWYNVEDEILQLKADGINTDAQLTLLDAGVLYLKDQNTALVNKIIDLEAFQKVVTNAYGQGQTYEAFQNILFSGNTPSARTAAREAYDLIRFQSQQRYQNALALGALSGIGIAIGGAVLGYASSRLEQEKTSNALYKNSNLTLAEKDEIYNSNIQSNILNISNFNYELSNLSTYQGFVNSNITTRQLVSDLQTNQITLNNKTITKFSLDNLNNFVKTQYGIYYDITMDGTLAIQATPTYDDFLLVGGRTRILGDLFLNEPNKSLKFGSRLQDNLIDLYGNTYVLGVATNILKYKAPTGASHKFYINNLNVATIDINGITAAGNNIAGINWNNITINKPTNFQADWNSTIINKPTAFPPDMTNVYTKTETDNLLNTKLSLSGGTMTGALNINFSSGGQYIYLNNTSSLTSGVIVFANNKPDYGYIGMGGTNEGGNYANNLFIQADNALIFNSGLKQSGDIPRMIILANGNIGIGTATPNYPLDVNGSVNIYTPSSYFGLVLGSYPYTFTGSTNNNNGVAGLMLSCKNSTNSSVITKPIIYAYVKDVGTTNMNTVVELRCQGNALNNPYYWGCYIRCDGSYAQNNFKNASGGSISFWSQDAGGTYRTTMLMSSSSTVAGTIINTLIIYGYLEANNLTIQTGGIINTPTIATSSILYNGSSIDNKFVSKTGDTMTGNLNINNSSIIFDNNLNDFKIVLWTGYGIGIKPATIAYTSVSNHSFYSGTTQTAVLNPSGTLTLTGNLGIGTASPQCKLQVWNGIASINAGSSYCVSKNYLSAGAVSIGSTTANYGYSAGWSASSASLMFECAETMEVGVAIGNNVTGNVIFESLFGYNINNGYFDMGRDAGFGVSDVKFHGKILGAYNVCKRNVLIFTPVQNILSPFNWYYNINLANYISYANTPNNINYYIFRIIISTLTANYADTNELCKTMMFNVFLSNYGGGNGTCRIYQILNSSTFATLVWINATTVGYYCTNTAGANAVMTCTIENIAWY